MLRTICVKLEEINQEVTMVKGYFRFFVAISMAVAVSAVVSGCAEKTVQVPQSTDTPKVEAVETPEVKPIVREPVQPIGSEEPLYSEPVDELSNLQILEGRSTGPMLPVYFDFDQSVIRQDQKGRMAKNAAFIKGNPKTLIVVEGNCDERGTNEYNMALGERRAQGAKKYLVNLGVAASRINTISYGEERPLNHGHDELAWSQNRRADFVQTR